MKKVGIITIYDCNNYGNRLQNYSLQQMIKKNNYEVETIKNSSLLNKGYMQHKLRRKQIHLLLSRVRNNILKRTKRNNKFDKFNKNITITNRFFHTFGFKSLNKYDYLVVGSDQVWNPTFDGLTDFELLSNEKKNNKIAFSASFGINELPEECKQKTKEALMKFKAISVREETGKKIVEELTGRQDIEVLVDPTMLLTVEEWDKVVKRPKQLKKDRYILNYFLGEKTNECEIEIDRIAKENNCQIINLLNPKEPFYATGPSEFLYLIKNAVLVCTDSFHAGVFSIIYNRPFIVFERKRKGEVSMNSRIETLLSKFHLEDRRFQGRITENLLKCDYTDAKQILKAEKERAINFLKKALDIEK